MPNLRRLAPLLLVGLIAAAPAPAVAQGGAGDDQYQDPFGGSAPSSSDDAGSRDDGSGSRGGNGSSGSDAASGQTAAPAQDAPSLTAEPQASLGGQTAAGRQELSRTGLDAPAVALLGVGLLVAGIGLRLRTVDGPRA